MQVLKTIEELQKIRKNIVGTVGFVPTMGALHNGHISLIKQARSENDVVIVSIFVNPTQFLPGEDLDAYPRKDEADKKICQMCKVDYVFMPEISTMYGKEEVLIKAPNKSYILEGKTRPGHFDGVLRVVLKLFNLTQPTNAYFGNFGEFWEFRGIWGSHGVSWELPGKNARTKEFYWKLNFFFAFVAFLHFLHCIFSPPLYKKELSRECALHRKAHLGS